MTAPIPTIPGYEVTRVLGEGGMGTVYEAWQIRPHRRVAIKLLRHGLLSPTLLRRFALEVEILGRIEHPAITRLYEAGSIEFGGGKAPFFAMEYVEGQPITDYVGQGNLAVREKVALIRRVVEGVHHAHQKGIIHRDLKPGNVLVDSSGQPKVLDFGVARIEQADIQITISPRDGGGLLGTLAYMSPEQAGGRMDDVEVRSDVYSLGILAFELLSGRRPYNLDGCTLSEAIRRIETQHPSKLGAVHPSLRGDLEAIVGKAIEKDKERRYASAAALADDLERHLENRPIEARVPSWGYRTWKFIRRHKALAGMVTVVFSALTAGLIVARLGLAQARRAEREARNEKERAQSNLRHALDAVDRFTTVMAEGHLSGIPDAAPVRRQLLGDAVSFYERFIEDNENDERVREELIWALTRLAEIEALMGGMSETRQLLEQKIENQTRRLEESPGDEGTLRGLARSWDRLGGVLGAQGNREEALQAYNNAIELKRRLFDRQPGVLSYRLELARSWSDRAALMETIGRRAEADIAFQTACEVLIPGVESDPGHAASRRDLARILERRAKFLFRAGEKDRAIIMYKEAGSHFRRLMNASPSDGEAQRDYARFAGDLGDILMREGKTGDALAEIEQSNRIYLRLAEEYPENAGYRRDCAISCGVLGVVYRKQKRYDEARESFDRGIRIAQELSRHFPYQPDLQRDLARLWTESGRLLSAAGMTASATGAIERACAILGDLTERYPENRDYLFDYARTSEELGCVYRDNKERSLAVSAYRRSDRLYGELLSRNPADRDAMAGRGYMLGNWASVVNASDARILLSDAREVWRGLIVGFPETSAYRKALEYVERRLEQLPASAGEAADVPTRDVGADGADALPSLVRVEEEQAGGAVDRVDGSRVGALARDRLLECVGRPVVVVGKVEGVAINIGRNEWTFLHFGRSRKGFSGVIHRSALPAFQAVFGERLELLEGRDVEIEGILSIHKESPQLILTRPDQLRVVMASSD